MKKWLCLVLSVVLVLTAFVGCSDKKTDDDTDEGEKTGLEATVATVNDAVIKRGEVEEMLESQLGYYMYMLDETTLQGYREQILTILIQQEVARQKAKELGYNELTEEDLAEIDKSFQDFYDNGIEYYTGVLKEEDAGNGVFEEVIESTDYTERAKAELLTYLEESFYYSIERFEGETLFDKYKNYVKDSYIVSNKLLLGETADVTVEETAVKAEYDSLLNTQKESYDKDVTAYETAVSTNMQNAYYGMTESPIVYVPEGLRYVKHILVMFTEEDQTTVGEKYSTFSSAEYNYETAESDLEAAQKAVNEAADDAALATAQTELATAQTAYDKAKTEYDTAKKAYDDAVAAASANIKDKVDEVYGKVQAGEDFATLIATYGEDPGMENEMYKDKGYMLSKDTTTYYEIFTTTGMALEKVGDYSEPVYSTSGAHIIQYTSDVKAGEIPYEDAKESIEKVLLEEAQNAKFSELLTTWQKDGFKITQYTDALSATIEEPEATEEAETK